MSGKLQLSAKQIADNEKSREAYLKELKGTQLRNMPELCYGLRMNYLTHDSEEDIGKFHIEKPFEFLDREKALRRTRVLKSKARKKHRREKKKRPNSIPAVNGKNGSDNNNALAGEEVRLHANSLRQYSSIDSMDDSGDSEPDEEDDLGPEWSYVNMAGCFFWVNAYTGMSQSTPPPGFTEEDAETLKAEILKEGTKPTFREFANDVGTGAAVYEDDDYKHALDLLGIGAESDGEASIAEAKEEAKGET
eukprot:CAMPEP_0118850678 /NCGR_PEP_ID=MMETSP1163-20130328/422_1 /TAXON_ID=124430 /ORGANISM="Phaeomonas parva, Strain CCMP2877" /LENGTH=248 /DNA_ID=CAMNT_0006782909 /DNA_START=91 /DNA_END=837 /DNA_ORIENTATION=+